VEEIVLRFDPFVGKVPGPKETSRPERGRRMDVTVLIDLGVLVCDQPVVKIADEERGNQG